MVRKEARANYGNVDGRQLDVAIDSVTDDLESERAEKEVRFRKDPAEEAYFRDNMLRDTLYESTQADLTKETIRKLMEDLED